MNCDGDMYPVSAGPFVITPGFSELDLVLLDLFAYYSACSGPLDFVVTLSDGSTLKHTTTSSLAGASPGGRSLASGTSDPQCDALTIDRVGSSLVRVHAGDEASVSFLVTNSDPSQSFTGTFRATSTALALLPEVPAGQNDSEVGAFSLSDPAGGNAFPIAFPGLELGNTCIGLPPDPGVDYEIELPLTLPPGGSQTVTCGARTIPMCPRGTMSKIGADVSGSFSGGSPCGAAIASFVAVDNTILPAFACPGAVRMASYLNASNPSGPAVGIAGDGSAAGNEAWQVNIGADRANMSYLADGVPPTSGTFSFSQPTMFLNGLSGRYVSEISFITPRTPDTATNTLIVPFDVLPAATSPHPINVQIVSLQVLGGAPSGYANHYPIIAGRVHVQSTNGIADAVLDFRQQLSAVGVVDGTFDLEAMELVSVNATKSSDTRYVVTSSWMKKKLPKAAGTTEYVGFAVANDFRAVAGAAAPLVSVDPPVAAPGGIRLLAVPNPASAAAAIRFSGAAAAPEGARVAVYDAAGRLVRRLDASRERDTLWDLSDGSGRGVAPGVYLLRAEQRDRVVASGRLHVIR
jgi:hypothetical protein